MTLGFRGYVLLIQSQAMLVYERERCIHAPSKYLLRLCFFLSAHTDYCAISGTQTRQYVIHPPRRRALPIPPGQSMSFPECHLVYLRVPAKLSLMSATNITPCHNEPTSVQKLGIAPEKRDATFELTSERPQRIIPTSQLRERSVDFLLGCGEKAQHDVHSALFDVLVICGIQMLGLVTLRRGFWRGEHYLSYPTMWDWDRA